MYAQKARHPNNAKKSSDAGTSSQQRSPKLLCYIDESKTKPYFVYWKNDEMVLGVTDMGEDLFEAVLDRKERKKLLKNVAESIVDNKWRYLCHLQNIMKMRGFIIKHQVSRNQKKTDRKRKKDKLECILFSFPKMQAFAKVALTLLILILFAFSGRHSPQKDSNWAISAMSRLRFAIYQKL